MPVTPVLEVEELKKTYVTPLRRRQVHAVRGVSFAVQPGEIFGFLGPNGAGKTTTIRTLMGLIRPTSGVARIFGHEVPSREARAKLGFLPEAPYFYDYLTISELIDLAGRLFGMSVGERRARASSLIELVNMKHAADKPLKSYSKGMLQRAGIAQALVHDPDLVVMDEPMGGLDPVGRKEVRDIVLNLRDQGKTVFFSSHILADVEAVADRIAIIAGGRLKDVGTLRELIGDSVVYRDVTLHIGDADFDPGTAEEGVTDCRRLKGEVHVRLSAEADLNGFIKRSQAAGAAIISVTPHHDSLEDLFVRTAEEAS